MEGKTFISTTVNDIARATLDGNGPWQVEKLLSGRAVICLAAAPLNLARVYEDPQGIGFLPTGSSGGT